MKDLIKCCNCGFIGLVDTGQEYCPQCNKKGCLSWLDENNQEIDPLDNQILKVNKRDIIFKIKYYNI